MGKSFSEKGYVNRLGIISHTVIAVVLFLAYTIELLKGARTFGYYLIFSVVCLAPVFLEWVLYKKDNENGIIRHMMGCSYSFLYIFVLFTTTSGLAFTYALPMYMVIILFMDVKYCVAVATGGTLVNIGYIVYIMIAKTTSVSMEDLEIRVAVMILIGAFMVISTRAAKIVNNEKIKVIQKQTEEASRLTENVLNISGGMVYEIGEVSEKITRIGDSMDQIHTYMGEVSTGSTETAESVEQQLHRTETIQQLVAQVKDSASGIEQNMQNTSVMVEDGRIQMQALSDQVVKSMGANEQVLNQMTVLSEYTKQMNTIIATITSIANSTVMLALNASIEAARAGESGKGFAVVASQISDLANQTKSATVNITDLINNINEKLKLVEDAVNVVTESNKSNSESTQVVIKNFADIAQGADDVGVQTKELTKIVKELEVANNEIVESIQTISAITEEVSAHATETYNVCEANTELVATTTDVVKKLGESAQKLQNCKQD